MRKNQLNPNWLNAVLDKCESVGIQKHIIYRFYSYYLKGGKQTDA